MSAPKVGEAVIYRVGLVSPCCGVFSGWFDEHGWQDVDGTFMQLFEASAPIVCAECLKDIRLTAVIAEAAQAGFKEME